MNYDIITIPPFDKQLKRLAKKYPSIKNDIAKLGSELSENPVLGVEIFPNCYKIRLAIASKGKGKSGGARVITHIHISKTTVYLLSIYDKSERNNISDNEIRELLASI
ncbi:MAG: type II toxin-antitoxin system RelE/ParE family toxin [Bacteroidota bacterium]|nr:type II toxin-antitoxin system RelE/ParE family toxin [Bacteroidota bacterium]